MANVKITLNEVLVDGHEVTFKAPCDCTAIDLLDVHYVENRTAKNKLFTMKDTHGNALTGIGNLFTAGAYVHVILDTTTGSAYIQNGDTNGYLEDKFKNLKPDSIEFNGYADADVSHGGYLDFHYAGTGGDYTTRLIESAPGCLAVHTPDYQAEVLTTKSKPSGSYEGTGSATAQTTTLANALGANAMLVWNTSYFSLVTPMGALCVTPGGEIVSVNKNEASFADGVLKIATTKGQLNASGVTNYFQVL